MSKETKDTIKSLTAFIAAALVGMSFSGCSEASQDKQDKRVANNQQKQYAKVQPLPVFDWSLERERVIDLYKLRNKKVSTHTVWRSDYGIVEGDCTSSGYGIPYDTSLTNPLKSEHVYNGSSVAIGQAEPNGVFASTNTNATWVMCVGTGGVLEPVYVESKVTTYPYPVKVDYKNNRVYKR